MDAGGRRGGRAGAGSPEGPHFVSRHVPRAVEALPQDGVVRLLGNSTLTTLVEGGQVVFHKADDAILGRGSGCDGQEHVRMGHEVGVHL